MRDLSPRDDIDVAHAARWLVENKIGFDDRLRCYQRLERFRRDYTPAAYDAFVDWAINSARGMAAAGGPQDDLGRTHCAAPFPGH